MEVGGSRDGRHEEGVSRCGRCATGGLWSGSRCLASCLHAARRARGRRGECWALGPLPKLEGVRARARVVSPSMAPMMADQMRRGCCATICASVKQQQSMVKRVWVGRAWRVQSAVHTVQCDTKDATKAASATNDPRTAAEYSAAHTTNKSVELPRVGVAGLREVVGCTIDVEGWAAKVAARGRRGSSAQLNRSYSCCGMSTRYTRLSRASDGTRAYRATSRTERPGSSRVFTASQVSPVAGVSVRFPKCLCPSNGSGWASCHVDWRVCARGLSSFSCTVVFAFFRCRGT